MKRIVFPAALLLLLAGAGMLYAVGLKQADARRIGPNEASARAEGHYRALRSGSVIRLEFGELDEVVFREDWDNGAPGWTHLDGLSVPEERWRIDDFNPGNQGGSNWRCFSRPEAFGPNGGYENNWLHFLQTLELDLAGVNQASLSFEFFLQCEQGNNWDGANVWVASEDAGIFEVIEPSDGPAYNSDDIAAFSEVFMLEAVTGEPVPGWGGFDVFNQWQTVTFDLSPYVGRDDLRILFAFASDYGIDTRDNAEYTGFQVDDVAVVADGVTIFRNDADDEDDELSNAYGYPGSEHDFQVTRLEDAHSDSFALVAADSALRVVHYWESPQVRLPWIVQGESLLFDCWMRGEYQWEEEGDMFSFNLYVRPENTGLWYYASSPYDEGERVFYTGEPGPEWVRHSEAWPDYSWDATPYAGQTVTLRLVATYPAVYPIEYDGFQVDDFVVFWNSLEHDIETSAIHLPFPTTVGCPVAATVDFTNLGWSEETGWSASWRRGERLFSFHPAPPYDLEAGSVITLALDSDPNDEITGWVPQDPGEAILTAWHQLENDMQRVNDTVTVATEVRQPGEYEFGYDNRQPYYAVPFDSAGCGPMVHVEPAFHGDDFDGMQFLLREVRMLWYHHSGRPWVLDGEVALHIFAGGEEPGEELVADTFQVAWRTGMDDLNWLGMDFSDVDSLFLIEGDFYIWAELLTADETGEPVPMIVAAEQTADSGRYLEFSGENGSPAEYDYFLRAVVWDVNSVEDEAVSAAPGSAVILSTWPNPFNSSTTVSFVLPGASEVRVAVFDILGREVTRLAHRRYNAGTHKVRWNAETAASGIYFVRLETREVTRTAKVLLLK